MTHFLGRGIARPIIKGGLMKKQQLFGRIGLGQPCPHCVVGLFSAHFGLAE